MQFPMGFHTTAMPSQRAVEPPTLLLYFLLPKQSKANLETPSSSAEPSTALL